MFKETDELFEDVDTGAKTKDSHMDYQRTKSSKLLWIFAGTLILIPHLLVVPSLPHVLLGRGAPYVRTKIRAMEVAFSSLKNVIPGQSFNSKTFADLGSGDGRAVIEAAKQGFRRARGYEINPFLYILSIMRSMVAVGPTCYFSGRNKFGKETMIFYSCGSFWHKNVSEADVVFVYGLNPMMERLQQKLQNELAPGSYVVSHVFRFPTWTPLVVQDNLFIYTVGKKKDLV